MRRSLPLLFLLLAGSLTALAADAKDEILAAEKNWAKAVVALDFAELDKIYHPDLIYAHSTGIIQTKAEYMAKLKSGDQKYTDIIHHKTEVRTFGDAAVAHSIVTMKGSTKGVPFDNRLMLLHTWIKDGGRWRIAAHQTTELPK